MFRFARAINFLLDLAQDMSRNVFLFILCVDGQHPNNSFTGLRVVDNPNAASLSAAGLRPPHRSHAARTRHYCALFWTFDERSLQ
jgi:hypothetical protein